MITKTQNEMFGKSSSSVSDLNKNIHNIFLVKIELNKTKKNKLNLGSISPTSRYKA